MNIFFFFFVNCKLKTMCNEQGIELDNAFKANEKIDASCFAFGSYTLFDHFKITINEETR